MRIDSTFKPKYDNTNVVKKSAGVTIPDNLGSKLILNNKGTLVRGKLDDFSYEVAGFYYHKDWAITATKLENAYPGSASVTLHKEHNNKYDPNAILIRYNEETKKDLDIPDGGDVLGYIPQRITKEIAKHVEEGHFFNSMVVGYTSPSDGNTCPTVTVHTDVYK